jgi:hypothetical protein
MQAALCSAAARGPPPACLQTKRLQKRHWRKSSQFFSLTRRHAEAVVRDREVYSA